MRLQRRFTDNVFSVRHYRQILQSNTRDKVLEKARSLLVDLSWDFLNFRAFRDFSFLLHQLSTFSLLFTIFPILNLLNSLFFISRSIATEWFLHTLSILATPKMTTRRPTPPLGWKSKFTDFHHVFFTAQISKKERKNGDIMISLSTKPNINFWLIELYL